jgi:glutamate-1-semialdehyde 2,1-aminomutase
MALNSTQSDKLFARAVERLPGGVNSPVRAFRSVGRNPIFISRAQGSRLWDADGNSYVDYVGSWGPMILGHGHPAVIEALVRATAGGTSFGAPTELEVKMAELLCEIVPSLEMVRMVNSGTEATMSAIRLARAFTRREKILKFEGCYHGHGDSFLIKAGSGAMTLGVPDSPGVPAATAAGTLTAPFNNLEAVEELVGAHPSTIASIIVEPVAGNMGCVPPARGFLEGLRALCTREGIVLIFDEVMTGFRLALGGAQELYSITPDLTTMGKIIGGGLPVGAYGGKREIMSMVAPSGPMYQAGTLSGNPLAMTAGLETLTILRNDKYAYRKLDSLATRLAAGIKANLESLGIAATQNRVGSMFTLFFTGESVTDYRSAATSDTVRFGAYFRSMLEQGVYLAPSQFEAAFLSLAHTEEEIDLTIAASRKALETVYYPSGRK